MSSKIKVDTIENVAGSGNVSLGSGHNLVVPGTLNITGASTLTGGIANAGTITAGTLGSSVVFPAGHVLQFVQKTSSTVVTQANSSSLTTFGLSQAFTPKFASSTIFLMANVAGEHYGSHTDRGLRFDFTKDGSQIRYWPYVDYHSSDGSQNISTQTLLHSESAGNTSARTYEVRFCCTSNTNSTGRINNYNSPSRLVIMEVAG